MRFFALLGLMMGTTSSPASARLYIHDHLYSPVALVYATGTILERYEYDAYGNCYVLEPNFAPDSDGRSNYGNPYLFTGRRVDILDSGSLKIQYNRNRCYDYYTGRWLSHDPLGYVDGMNLYEYVLNNPILWTDSYGFRRKCDKCDPGDMNYEILDYILTPWHTNPWGRSAIRLGKAGTSGATIAQIVLKIYELYQLFKSGTPVSVLPTDILNIFVTEEIFKQLDRLDKILKESGTHAYLEIQLNECKKKSFLFFFCRRYDWVKYKKGYYMCTAGTPSGMGVYDDNMHALEYAEDCMDEFDEKWKEEGGKDFVIENWGVGFIPW